MAKTADETVTEAEWVSPVFGDIVAKMILAVDLEVERRLRSGLPVVVERGNGIEQINV
jgi:hypothetical protein